MVLPQTLQTYPPSPFSSQFFSTHREMSLSSSSGDLMPSGAFIPFPLVVDTYRLGIVHECSENSKESGIIDKMKALILFTILLLTLGFLYFLFKDKLASPMTTGEDLGHNLIDLTQKTMGQLVLASSAFENGGAIPSKYTCDGGNTSPPLFINGVPDGVMSLVLIMDDPDVPKNIRADGMWDHWVVFNIPPSTSEIKEGIASAGMRGVGTSGGLDYTGPCPPDREHRYFFKLYALDVELNLDEGASKREVEMAMEGHVVDSSTIIGRYNRER